MRVLTAFGGSWGDSYSFPFYCDETALYSFNQTFPADHPSVPMFVEQIKKISIEYVSRLADIAAGRLDPPVREPPTIPQVPADYAGFVPPPPEVVPVPA